MFCGLVRLVRCGQRGGGRLVQDGAGHILRHDLHVHLRIIHRDLIAGLVVGPADEVPQGLVVGLLRSFVLALEDDLVDAQILRFLGAVNAQQARPVLRVHLHVETAGNGLLIYRVEPGLDVGHSAPLHIDAAVFQADTRPVGAGDAEIR